MSLNKSKAKFITFLLIFSVIILIMPILAIKIDFIRGIALWLFKNGNNAREYMQFSGTFLGTIGAIGGAVFLIDKKGDV